MLGGAYGWTETWQVRTAPVVASAQRNLGLQRSSHYYFEPKDFDSRLITAASSQGLAAGRLLADRVKASPAHRSADPKPPMLDRCTVNTRASVLGRRRVHRQT